MYCKKKRLLVERLLNNLELSYHVVCSPSGLLGPLTPILRLGAGLRFLFEKHCKRQALLHNLAEASCTFTIRTKLFFSKIRLKTRLLPKLSQPSKNTQRSCCNSRPILYYVCQSKFMSLSIRLMVLRLAVLEVDAMETFCNEFFFPYPVWHLLTNSHDF